MTSTDLTDIDQDRCMCGCDPSDRWHHGSHDADCPAVVHARR